jgi:hypothetical protein
MGDSSRRSAVHRFMQRPSYVRAKVKPSARITAQDHVARDEQRDQIGGHAAALLRACSAVRGSSHPRPVSAAMKRS